MTEPIDFEADEREREREIAARLDVPYPPPHRDREAGMIRVPPRVPLAESYLTQRLRVAGATGAVDVVPAAWARTPDLPFLLPAHVVSAWSPNGRLETLERNLGAGERLRGHLAAMLTEYVPATTYAPDRSWAEESVVLEGLTDDTAVLLGRMLGQPAVVRLDGVGVHVLPTGLADVWAASVPGYVVKVAPETCPMRLDASKVVCRNPGGPFTSRSMEVGHVWLLHRLLLTELLGCGVCADGAIGSRTQGSPVPLTEVFVTSRWGGWQY